MPGKNHQRLLANVSEGTSWRAGDRVGVAVSGGADSVALLLLLLDLREKLGVVLSVAHFNHKLRGRASDADEKFVAKLAAKYGLTFHSACTDVAAKAKREKSNLEDAARRARYAFFDKLVADGHITHIAVAHTADDQAETVLAHILRGTGLAGLAGIHPQVGTILRPLLSARRADLRAFLKSRKQTWREDATNRDTTKTRARIRKKLLPLLVKQFNPSIVEHLATLAEFARTDEAFLDGIVEERFSALVKKQEQAARIETADLLEPWKGTKESAETTEGARDAAKINTTDALRKRLIRRLVQEVKMREGQLTSQHVNAILELAMRGSNGKSLQLPGNVEVRRERSTLIFLPQTRDAAKNSKQKNSSHEFEYKIDSVAFEQPLRVSELHCAFRFRVIDWPAKRGETIDTRTVLDCDRLRFPLVLRNWRSGDRLHPVGRGSARKLKRLFNEKRISRWERDGWPVLTSGGVLAWARGFSVAAEFAVNERTQKGILIVEENS